MCEFILTNNRRIRWIVINKELNICKSFNKRSERERERIMSRQIFDIITNQQQYMYKYRCGVLEIFF
jgi:hypothetical protein